MKYGLRFDYMENYETDDSMDSVEIPIDGTLDLHTFSPRELKELIPGYLETCREKDILQVRIIHGKGTGSLRRTVHSILGKNSSVASYRLAGEDAGGWGATLVILKEIILTRTSATKSAENTE